MTTRRKEADADTLRYLWTPDLDPLFWREERTDVDTIAWCGHVPFAHWIVGAVKPRCLVELGTHRGVSYSAFCEAVVRNKLEARCYAVDTWIGDDQAGLYSEEVYNDFRRFHDERYGGFSSLLRCTFNEAVPHMSDCSIDLLHIDGLHTYDAVRHDFEAWRPKLSENAVILFHDTNVREADFGVWRLWEELQKQFPSFEFLHSHGLGLLAVGSAVAPPVSALCSLTDAGQITAIRERFSFLGERSVLLNLRSSLREQELAPRDARIQALETETTRLQAEMEQRLAAEEELRIRAAQRTAQARAEAAEALARLAKAEANAEAAFEAGKSAGLVSAAAKQTKAIATEVSLVRRAIDMARWILSRRLTDNLRERVPGFSGGRVRGVLAYLLNDASLSQTTVREVAPGSECDSISTPTRLLFISGEPDTPGHHYRVLRYVEAAVAAGAEASWIRAEQARSHSKEISNADIVFIWRGLWDENIAYSVELARRSRARVVYDIDDLLVDPELVRVDVIDGIRTNNQALHQWQKNVASFQAAMLAADYCAAPTEELAGHIRRLGRPAIVLPNGFDRTIFVASRHAVRGRRSEKADQLVRIGYAGGSTTHQRDFAVAAEALVRVLIDRPNCRLTLFRFNGVIPAVNIQEFKLFEGIQDRIEWRDVVPLQQLPQELARFDINIAPLEAGNVFCEAKSELKFFEAALVDVPTIASPTGPFRRAIRDGITGFLANDPEEWYVKLLRLVDDSSLRYRLARSAQHEILWHNGPLRRADVMLAAIPLMLGDDRTGARGFALELSRTQQLDSRGISFGTAETMFEADQLGDVDVTVVVALHNCSPRLEETLESIKTQNLKLFDLVIVDDYSSDKSLSIAAGWAESNTSRFNRIVILRNKTASGLNLTRNTGIDIADTPFVFLLDGWTRLLPQCVESCRSAIDEASAALVYPQVREVGNGSKIIGNHPFEPASFIGGNAALLIALISKEAWSAVRGFADCSSDEKTADFWSRMVRFGLWGCPVGDSPLAEHHVDGRFYS